MMNLREVREYYGKGSGLLSFMNLVFVAVIAGLGIYIADIASSGEDNDTQVFCLYTVFIIGVLLFILLIFSCFMGRRGEYEAAFKFRRLLSVVACVIGIMSLGVNVVTTVQTYSEWDGYTTAIFAIAIVGSVFTIIGSVLMFAFSLKGGRYYDGRKNAKDIPDNMTLEGNNKKYMFMINICYTIFSVSIFLLARYFAGEIDTFSIKDASDYGKYSSVYTIVSAAGLITAALVLVSGALLLISKSRKMYKVNMVMYILNTIVQVVFSVYSVFIIKKDFVKAQYPDITYIVFAILLVVISAVFAMKSASIAKTFNQKQ